jgi:hypothetical protein
MVITAAGETGDLTVARLHDQLFTLAAAAR